MEIELNKHNKKLKVGLDNISKHIDSMERKNIYKYKLYYPFSIEPKIYIFFLCGLQWTTLKMAHQII